uniref:exocyst complex component 3-like protein 4 n=1 Tax=Euleptes europaea TaxID=460621 RepID=UPI00254002E9|nr:exocyst complex component 3-like protein 4 [Euleptes europaea]
MPGDEENTPTTPDAPDDPVVPKKPEPKEEGAKPKKPTDPIPDQADIENRKQLLTLSKQRIGRDPRPRSDRGRDFRPGGSGVPSAAERRKRFETGVCLTCGVVTVPTSDFLTVTFYNADMDDNKTGMQEADLKAESPSESGPPEKCTESEDSCWVAQLNSPPLDDEGGKETKSPKKSLGQMLSFSRGTSKSVKETSTKEPGILRSSKQLGKSNFAHREDCVHASKGNSSAPEESAPSVVTVPTSDFLTVTFYNADMDDNKTGMQEADLKAESPSESGPPEKCTESEDSCWVAQLNSPPLDDEGGKETKSPKKSLGQMLSFSRGTSKSVKETSTKEPGILRSSKRLRKSNFAHREDCVHASKGNSSAPEESGEFEDDSNKKQLPSVQSFSRRISQSFKEISTKEPRILRSSKRFATKWIEGRVHKESRSHSEESGTLEDNCITKEPLSVMEINTLIQTRQLLEAFEYIKDFEMELLAERDAKKYEDNPKEYRVKAKDIGLLYDHVSKVIWQIVQETLDLPSLDEKALTSLPTLIEKEEKAHPEASTVSCGAVALGSARNWRELWKAAVSQSVKGRVGKVPVSLKDDDESWLSVHLGFLRTAIREDLLKVKLHVQKCYPPDYNVCGMYVEAFHEALSVHLCGFLEDNSLTLSELCALLNWISNVYHSEEFLGHPDLKPDIKTEDLPSLLTPEALAKLKNDYIDSLKEKTKICLDNILALLAERKWDWEEDAKALQSQPSSLLSFHIQMMVAQHMKASGNICNSLEAATLEISLKEVTEFVPRFEKAFVEWDKENDHPQFVELMVAYINDFHDLMTGLKSNFSISCQELEKTLNDVMLRYQKYFLNKLRLKTQPMFKKILSKQWILRSETLDSFIMKALSVTEEFSKPLNHLKEPVHKDFLQEIHRYVVKEYITQTLKSKSKMRRRRWEEVSKLMKQDAAIIDNSMKHLGSSSDWLLPAIPHIADIIGEKKKQQVRECLKNLSRDYPDIRREHVLALLALRGWWPNTRQSVAHQIDGLSDGLQTASDRTLFAEIELPNTTQCF